MNWQGYTDTPCDVWGCTEPATHQKLEVWGFWFTKRRQRCAGHADSSYTRRDDSQWFYKADT